MNSDEARQLMVMLVDGDIRPEDVERLADYLTEFPDLVPELRADLRLTERLSQALCGTRTAEAFAAMTETRISAEESADKFTAGVMDRIPSRREHVVGPVAWRRWLVPLAAAASVAIVAGVWWFNQGPAAGLGLRVAEARGKCSVFSGQGSGVISHSSVGRSGQASGVTESPSHQVTGSQVTSHKALRVGDVLRPGDGVEVGADGFVKLAYLDGTQVELQHDTRMRVTRGVGSEKTAKRLALDGGKFVCSAAPQKKPFEIRTRHAVARVVGTRFSLDVTDPKTVLAVMEGKVALCQGDKILLVEAGAKAVATDEGMDMVRAAVYAWGLNDMGQLGDGTTDNTRRSQALLQVPGLCNISAVSAGYGHTVALQDDGTVMTWGINRSGQLGDGTTTDRPIPVQVVMRDGTPLSRITAVAAGYHHTVALTDDGTVFAWGLNKRGQLGDGTTNSRPVPDQVKMSNGAPLSDIIAIAAGMEHTVALDRDGSVWAWGCNDYGQIADGGTTSRLMPVHVKTVNGIVQSNVIAIAAGYEHTAALGRDGHLLVWGKDDSAAASPGNGYHWPMVKYSPGLSNLTAVAAGQNHTVALRRDGTVFTLGNNKEGQLGHEASQGLQVRMQDGAALLSNVTAIAAGGKGTVALLRDGTVWAWGRNRNTDGTGFITRNPAQVKLPDGTPLANVTAIAAGYYHTVVVGGSRGQRAWSKEHGGEKIEALAK